MSTIPSSETMHSDADLEERQEEVIRQLDELNQRVENLIELYTRIRQTQPSSSRDE